MATNDLIIFVSTTGDITAFGRLLAFTLVEFPLHQLSSNLVAGWTGRPAVSRLMASLPVALDEDAAKTVFPEKDRPAQGAGADAEAEEDGFKDIL